MLMRMLEEIYETPKSVRETLEKSWNGVADFVKTLLDSDCRSLYVVGSGASYNAALSPVFITRRQERVQYIPVMASEFISYPPRLKSTDKVLIVSVSGRNKDVLELVKRLPKSQVAALINDPDSPLEKEVCTTIRMYAGEQKTIAASKTVTATMAALTALAVEMVSQTAHSVDTDVLKRELLSTPEVIETVLQTARPVMKEIARKICDYPAFYIVSAGPNWATAREAALKFKEAARAHAEAYPARDLVHGPIYGITNTAPIIEISANGPGFSEVDQTGRIFLEVGAPVVKVTNVPCEPDRYVGYYEVPHKGGEDVAPLAFLPALQLLSYELAAVRGINIDKPQFYDVVHRALRVD